MNTRLLIVLCSIFMLVACGDEGTTPPGNADVPVNTDTAEIPDTVGPDVSTCETQCDGKQCGDDGCGGSCGTCIGGTVCAATGICEAACQPDCANKNCGGDGCGGFCGQCSVGEQCTAAGVCEGACQPDCTDKNCGDDGCGASCGECLGAESCNAAGLCEEEVVAVPCGDVSYEGCCDGATLKYCDNGSLAEADCLQFDGSPTCGWDVDSGWYSCGVEGADPTGANPLSCDGTCVADCSGKFCGDDGCGGSCGDCAEGESCNDAFQCASVVCEIDCQDKACGPDGCGGTCGDCGFGAWCDAGGQCNQCEAACEGKSCGPDGCGGTCGECEDGFTCDADGQCFEGVCVADCEGKTCGSDGCGGECGDPCNDGLTCVEGQCIDGGSCAGFCGSPAPTDAGCYCDDLCFNWGDCCEDICETCNDLYTDLCCAPNCDGKQCGDDGCGGTCGAGCEEGSVCNDVFQCVEEETCDPTCGDKLCGADGCGGSCGACEADASCSDEGQCVASAPTASGTWIQTYSFEEEQAPYLNCQTTTNLISVASVELCEGCDYAWEFNGVPTGTTCGDWAGEQNENTIKMGVIVATSELFFYNEESAEWGAFSGVGTVVGDMYTGNYSTGPIYYMDMNESGDYDEGEALGISFQIGLTW